MVVIGLDLGTKFPARATLDLGASRPVLTSSVRGNLSKLDAKLRPEAAANWLHRELELGWEAGVRTVAIEDPRNTSVQLLKRQANGARSTLLILHLFAQTDMLARAIGFHVVHVEPREVISRLGLKLTRGAKPEQRRREKKAQTKRWCEIVLGVRLDEDRADAASVAFVGGGKVRALQRAPK